MSAGLALVRRHPLVNEQAATAAAGSRLSPRESAEVACRVAGSAGNVAEAGALCECYTRRHRVGIHGDLLARPLVRTYTADDLLDIARALAPSNAAPNHPNIQELPGLALAVLNPVSSVRDKAGCVCLGALVDSQQDWWRVGLDSPDGSYAICRSDDDRVELVTDDFGSRPLWYVQTADVFLASTSQRAIVRLLGDFRLNSRAVSWMLSAGFLGPEDSWDSRLRRVPRGTRLTLDRHVWTITSSRAAPLDDHDRLPISPAEQATMLDLAVTQTCEALDLEIADWRLPLSGGKDSRCLLIYLQRAGHRPKCITWGMEQSRLAPDSDAHVAASVAAAMGVAHEYFVVDRTTEAQIDALGRYVATSEVSSTTSLLTWTASRCGAGSTVGRGWRHPR